MKKQTTRVCPDCHGSGAGASLRLDCGGRPIESAVCPVCCGSGTVVEDKKSAPQQPEKP